MICNNTVKVWRNDREIEYKCGNHIYDRGTVMLVMCQKCKGENVKKYPQGWNHFPGDTCKHGTYVGDRDYLCLYCEGVYEE